MEQIAWTAIGLLAATLFSSFFYLGQKIDSLGARLDARIDGLGARLDARLDGVESRLDAINARLDVHIERHAG
ncbi:MAG TPA: hypothetical protein VJ922_07680 [Actinomycetota bacterium]|nr:hypothetical protein [Actinomycetota bacterium]